MITLLSKKRNCTVKELSEELEVSAKTVHRYKKDLEQLGYEIKSTRGENASYKLVEKLEKSVLDDDSSETLIKALVLAEEKGDYRLASQINQLIKLYESGFEGQGGDEENRVFKDRYDAIETRLSNNLLEDVEYAIDRLRVMKIEYSSPYKKETTVREIEPYVILNYSGTKYVIAHCRKANNWRTFHILRVSDYAILSKTFERKDDFDIDSITTEFGLIREKESFELKVQLFGYRAQLAKERKLNDTQQITEIPNGVEMKVELRSHPEAISWILSMGSNAKVISPQNIVDELKSEIIEMSKYYTTDSD